MNFPTSQSNRNFFGLLTLATTIGVLASAAEAHPGHGASGFLQGFSHPLGGWDHVLAMFAVGLWASQLATVVNRRALWAVPFSFVGVMIIGGLLGVARVPVPGVEAGIAASVLILGVMIASAARMPLGASLAIVASFALFHGHAHGVEMPGATSGLLYGAGFVIATIAMHAAGIGAGVLMHKLQRQSQSFIARGTGAAIACGGILFVLPLFFR
jgi:urease accessory protein